MAYTFQQCSNAYGQYLAVTEHRVSGHRKVIIIPKGKLKSGWRVFELELRKLLEPSKQALVVSGHGKTLVQHPKRHSVVVRGE